MKNNYYLTTGEFSSLCNTTKETLRHYKNIGILEPRFIGENGYQYYLPVQINDFYLINSMKKSGSSLLDIKKYMERPDTNEFLQVLHRQKQSLVVERMKLEHMEQLLQSSIDSIELALSTENGIEDPTLVSCEEEYFIATKVTVSNCTSITDFSKRVNQHLHYCSRNNFGVEFQIGMILTKDDLINERYFERYYYSKINKPYESERLYIKPKSDYVTTLYRGIWNGSRAYPKLLDYIKQNELVICGNAYEYVLAGYLLTGDLKNYISQVSIQVE